MGLVSRVSGHAPPCMRPRAVVLCLMFSMLGLLLAGAALVFRGSLEPPGPAQHRRVTPRPKPLERTPPSREHSGPPLNCFGPGDERVRKDPARAARCFVEASNRGLPALRPASSLVRLYDQQREWATHVRGAEVLSERPLVVLVRGLANSTRVERLREGAAAGLEQQESGFLETSTVVQTGKHGKLPPGLPKELAAMLWELSGVLGEETTVEVGTKQYPDPAHSLHRMHIDGGQGEAADAPICGQTFEHVLTSAILYLDSPDGGQTYFPALQRWVEPRQGDWLMFQNFRIDPGCRECAEPASAAHWPGSAHLGCGLRSGSKRIQILNILAAPHHFQCGEEPPGEPQGSEECTEPEGGTGQQGSTEPGLQGSTEQQGSTGQQGSAMRATKQSVAVGVGEEQEKEHARIRCVDGSECAMPRLVLGTGFLQDPREAVKMFLASGGRHIDTAVEYGTHAAVGEAVRASGISRSEIWISTKIPSMEMGDVLTQQAIARSLKELGMEYVDLLMLHTAGGEEAEERSTQPCLNEGWALCRKQAWEALLEAGSQRKARAIGVSNFGMRHLKEIQERSGDFPAVNQLELHPWSNNQRLLAAMRDAGVYPLAYATTKLLFERTPASSSEVLEIAEQTRRSPSAVLQRWAIQSGAAVVASANSKEHILDNLSLFRFKLSRDQMAVLSDLKERIDFHEHEAWEDNRF